MEAMQSMLEKLIITYGPVIIGLLGIGIGFWQYRKTLNEQKKEAERKEIYKKLNEFYQPFLQLRKKSFLLYKNFNPEYKFRTLPLLLNGHKFNANQKSLLEEVIKIGNQCEELIHTNAGLIDTDKLRNEILPRLTTHCLIMRLAYGGNLKGQSSDYDDYTFPRELDSLLECRIKALENRLSILNS